MQLVAGIEEQGPGDTGLCFFSTFDRFSLAVSKNTIVYYMYRDASNYKQLEPIIVAGEVKREDLIACCSTEPGDDNGFIPSQVGLEDLQHRNIGYPNGDDHVWHELLEVKPTKKKPTTSLTAKKLLANFRARKDKWDVVAASEKHGI